jgi:ribosome-binding ATPase YchF (GTP1/OBG family)
VNDFTTIAHLHLIAQQTQPLRDQIEAMNLELSRLKLLEAHWSAAQEKISALNNQVQQLQSEMDLIGSLKAQLLELKTMVAPGSISSVETPHTSTPEELKKNPPVK